MTAKKTDADKLPAKAAAAATTTDAKAEPATAAKGKPATPAKPAAKSAVAAPQPAVKEIGRAHV